MDTISIVIPMFNEENYVAHTLMSLIGQTYPDGAPMELDRYHIVFVDNMSTDKSVQIVKEILQSKPKLNVHVIQEKTKSVVAARICGYHYALRKTPSRILASGDADIVFHKNWIYTIFNHFRSDGIDMIANAGCFPSVFWQRVPRLTERYLREIGTIFFDNETIKRLGVANNKVLFSEQVFHDFVRLPTDQCFAITRDMYIRSGGYTREFLDDRQNHEVFDEGGRLMIEVEKNGGNIIYSNKAPYMPSPRRALAEPERFFSGLSYVGGIMRDYRAPLHNADYKRLNSVAEQINYNEIKKYVVKNYILFRCVSKPELIIKNMHYFGKNHSIIHSLVIDWWEKNQNYSGNMAIRFTSNLSDMFYDCIVSALKKNGQG